MMCKSSEALREIDRIKRLWGVKKSTKKETKDGK